MSQKSLRSERFTAIASTLVAVAILAAGVTAQKSSLAPHDELVRLESDLRFQLERAFKHDGSRRDEKMARVDQVLGAWQDSPQSIHDYTLLATWLTDATVNSMPGASQTLPLAPEFGLPEQPTPQVSTPSELLPSNTPLIGIGDQSDDVVAVSVTEMAEPLTQQTAVVSSVNTMLLGTDASQPLVEPSVQITSPQNSQSNSLPVKINLRELTARIAGYHNGLDTVEAKLMTLREPDLGVVSDQIQQIEEMAKDFRFTKLYYESLTDQERRLISPPRSIQATLTELERQIDQFEEAQNDDFLSVFDSAQNEQIDNLRKQLVALAERIAL